MKRPHIPLKVKLAVAERQAFNLSRFKSALPWEERDEFMEQYHFYCDERTMLGKLRWLLDRLFHSYKAELDHDPALVLRRRSKRTGKYIPDANDPRYLVYRRGDDHLRKTVGRTPGAERTVTSKGSDRWLAKKWKKLESPKKSKSRKILSRPFRASSSPGRSRR